MTFNLSLATSLAMTISKWAVAVCAKANPNNSSMQSHLKTSIKAMNSNSSRTNKSSATNARAQGLKMAIRTNATNARVRG